MAIAELTAQTQSDVSEAAQQSAAGQAVGGLIGTLGSTLLSSGIFSDSRLKDNIQLIKRLDSGVGLFSWEWNDMAKKIGINNKRTKGVIAQDVKRYFPDLVWEDRETGYFKVNTWKALLT